MNSSFFLILFTCGFPVFHERSTPRFFFFFGLLCCRMPVPFTSCLIQYSTPVYTLALSDIRQNNAMRIMLCFPPYVIISGSISVLNAMSFKALRRSRDAKASAISTPISTIPLISKPPSAKTFTPQKVIRAIDNRRATAPQELSFSKGDFFYVTRELVLQVRLHQMQSIA
jgi:hypothetical protein